MADAPRCLFCSRATYDPAKSERPWARAVSRGHQVLVCPRCQAERSDWQAALDRCPACGGTRLGVMLGQVVCRACGHAWASSA